MKRVKLFSVLLFLGFLAGCFEDKGNYNYEELNPPKWVQEFNEKTPKNIYSYAGEGEKMVLPGSSMFKWTSDSATRAGQVRYEWKLEGVVIGNELDMEIPTDEVVKKMNLKEYTNSMGLWGTFSIIEKENEVTFPARILVYIYPPFAPDDWFVLSESGGNSKLSVIRERKVSNQGTSKIVYELKDNAYETINKSKIPGKPINLAMELAKDVSPSGACVIMTNEVAYEVNIQNLQKVNEVKDQFLDGTPPNFTVSDLREKASRGMGENAASYVATRDGRVFTRIKSENYLGGDYLTEPYYIDEKGYVIKKFGHTLHGGLIPCYDEKNRRIVMATTWREDIQWGPNMGDQTSVYRTRMIPLKRDYRVPVSGFPEGTQVLYLSGKSHISFGYGALTLLYSVYYNDPTMENRTLVGDFSFNNQSGALSPTGLERLFYLPVKLDESSVFLVSANLRYASSSTKGAEEAKYRDFYTVDNKLYYIQRGKGWMDDGSQRFLTFNATFNSKITSLAYAFYNLDKMMVGCEDGSIYCFDIMNINSPKLLYETKLDGKVACIKQIGWHTSNHDNY